jgi:hypothetical protein
VLSERYVESEALRKRHYEKNKELEKDNKKIRIEAEELKDLVEKNKKEANDIRKARTTNTKVLETKINNILKSNQELLSENSTLK